ncbi:MULTISPECIES: nucleoside hydrolase [unclassified Caballeronia]|uniref:nucleoside hydrolase n=1 Tax=unclassified Caballeronia TaxID=2646786 RepID=UPI00285611E1|nr:MULTISPECIES: nucleoside hydrolase [unclassified Caballeronia]MDR5752856.1 nucleoside hydrolase [Caballeronia sp. LZ024]MDR5841500.1 nucleoside hydrolase [Caballeronia sp. LZ031]
MRRRHAAGLILTLCVAGSLVGCGGSDHHDAYTDAPKIVIDSDFNTMGDDGQLFAMTTQLMAQGKVNLLGLCVVTGNDWLLQEEADALKAVERMGVQDKVGVYAGANYPLQYDVASIRAQQAANPNGYFGAWMRPEPTQQSQLTPPPDGFATSTQLKSEAAADFMIDTIKRYPNQVTIIEVGPPTNLATAVKKAPEIVPLIKQIVYMGGAMKVPGNANAVGELNWWFDPLAVRTLLQTSIPQAVIPLDVTNTVPLTETVYNQIVNPPTGQTAVTKAYASANAGAFASNTDLYDTLTIAYFTDPSYATQTQSAYLDIDTTAGENQGHVSVYPDAPPAGASPQKITYVTQFDNDRFFNLYVDLLTRPVPVKFQ